ncbi:MAG: hypothetical protein U9R72_15170 [Chloroflexota bacterium]|nr:hypothetical protein [Chloroflexota bacterium]
MGFLDKIAAFLTGGGDGDADVYEATVRCSRCGEEIAVRVDLRHELTPRYGDGEGAYYVHKGVMGSGENRCFQEIDVRFYFDAQRQLVSREITGGEFITEEALTGTEA